VAKTRFGVGNLCSGLKPAAPPKQQRLGEQVELFAWLEADGTAGGDVDLGSGAGVAAHAGFTGLDGENAKAAELDTITLPEGGLHGGEDGVDGGFCLGAWEASAFDDSLNQVLLDHCDFLFVL